MHKDFTKDELIRVKNLSSSVLEGDNIIKVAKEKNLDVFKVGKKAEEMSKMFPNDDFVSVTFARDKFSKGDYTCKAENSDGETFTEILDNNLRRYALESSNGFSRTFRIPV